MVQFVITISQLQVLYRERRLEVKYRRLILPIKSEAQVAAMKMYQIERKEDKKQNRRTITVMDQFVITISQLQVLYRERRLEVKYRVLILPIKSEAQVAPMKM